MILGTLKTYNQQNTDCIKQNVKVDIYDKKGLSY